jgi:hypothetical protein
MVIISLAQAAVTPAGKPVTVPIPVAPEVACVIAVKAVFTSNVGVLDAGPAVLVAFTVMFFVAVVVPNEPPLVVKVKVILPDSDASAV